MLFILLALLVGVLVHTRSVVFLDSFVVVRFNGARYHFQVPAVTKALGRMVWAISFLHLSLRIKMFGLKIFVYRKFDRLRIWYKYTLVVETKLKYYRTVRRINTLMKGGC